MIAYGFEENIDYIIQSVKAQSQKDYVLMNNSITS